MEELSFRVLIDPKLDQCPSSVGFGDFPEDASNAVYSGKSALSDFFRDLVMGRPLPLTFATREVRRIDTLIAIALFLHRDLAIEPTMLTLIVSAELVGQFPHAGLAHIDRDLSRFFRLLSGYLPSGLTRTEQHERLTTAVEWIRDYVLAGSMPALPREVPSPRVLDRGTNGFVVAEMSSLKYLDLELGWIDLYRQGFLRGVLFGAVRDERRLVLVAKKGDFLTFDLEKARSVLNEAEQAMGDPPSWEVRENWLRGPEEGTLLLPSMVLDVLLRV